MLILWVVLACLSVASLAAPALASEGVPAPPLDVVRQEWGLPLTIAELAGLVVVVVPIVMGCVQAAKRFGIEGKGSFALALVLGLVIGGLVVAASLGVLPGWAGIVIVIVLGGLLAGLAATGIYDLQNKSVKANKALAAEMAALAGKQALQTELARSVALLAEFAKEQQESQVLAEDNTLVYRGEPLTTKAPEPATFGGLDEAITTNKPRGHGIQGG